MSGQRSKRLIGAIAILIIVTVFASLLAWLNPLFKQQLYLSNFLYSEKPANDNVVVISIDDEAVSADGLGKFGAWCRTYYVPVLEHVAEYEPKAIGIDILFLSKSKGLCEEDLMKIIDSDSPEAEILKYADPIVHPDDQAFADVLGVFNNLVMLTRVIPGQNFNGYNLDKDSYIQYPLETLINSSTLFGHNRFYFDEDGLIRNMSPFFTTGDNSIYSLSLRLALTYLDFSRNSTMEVSNNGINILEGDKSLYIPLEDSQMKINFREKTSLSTESNGDITVIPFMDLYRGETDFSDIIKNKIVLIGDRYSSSSDKYQIPINPDLEIHGVMIHAQAIQTILDQAWLYSQPLWSQIVTIALLVLVSLAIIFMLQIVLALPLLVILIAAYVMLGAPMVFNSHGVILNLVYPPLAVVISAIVGYAYRYVTEFKQKTKVTGALGQYVNKEVADKVLDQDSGQIETGGENKKITVLFTDIKGFTTISENLKPESVVALLNEYFEAMTSEVIKQEGVVDKFEGDALMAFFEDIPGTPPHAVRAAKTSLGMRRSLQKLMAKWQNDAPLPGGEPKPQIDFRLGLSSGEALVGNIGSAAHIQYTVIGDIVNLGSRLEGANKKYHTSVMMSEATYTFIQNDFECRFLDVIKVKGKDKPVKIYELLAPKGQLSAEQTELIQAYNKALVLYFEKKFPEALEILQNEVLQKWPADYLANLYAGRCELLNRFPPAPGWDFVYKMETK